MKMRDMISRTKAIMSNEADPNLQSSARYRALLYAPCFTSFRIHTSEFKLGKDF